MKLFYTGPNVTAELLVVLLDNHGIASTVEPEEEPQPDNDLDRVVRVSVAEQDYDRAYQLFYADKEGEL